MSGFEKIIQKIDVNLRALDVGAWGLRGENTSQYLQDRFGKNVTCLNIEQVGHKIDIVANWYVYDFKNKRFDVIAIDLGSDNNIKKDWTNKELKRVHGLLNPRGILINYIITNRKDLEYQDVNISTWFDVLAIFPENKRENIVWIALQKK